MATNFPTSADSFTNPTAVDTLDSPPHDQQHADINDAMEAVQTALLDGAPLHIDDANERVGIGTTAPETPLTIDTTNKLGSSFTGTTAGEGLRVVQTDYTSGNYVSLVEGTYDDNSTDPHVRIGAMYDGGGSQLSFGTTNSYGSGITNEALSITSEGNVGIGDTTPSYTLDVNGDINATGDLRIGGAAIGTYTDYSSSVTFGGFTKGTSTVVAKYARVGKFVHYWGYVITHSGFSMTGPLDVSLPIAATGGILTTNSPCSFYDGSTITWGTAINLGGSTMRLVTHAAGGTYAFNADVASNVPFTWATGDAFYWNHYYEAA